MNDRPDLPRPGADPRATRGGVRTAAGAITAATASAHPFGVRIACGQAARSAPLPAAERHWLRRPEGGDVFAPHLHWHFAARIATRAASHTRTLMSLRQMLVRENVVTPARTMAAAPAQAARQTLVERVIERMQPVLASGVRVERVLQFAPLSSTPASAAATPVAAPRAIVSPVTMVMRHEHASRAPAATPTAPEAAFAPRLRNELAVSGSKPLPAAALPAHDLNRITDAVVQSLDRRLRSYRERLGMI